MKRIVLAGASVYGLQNQSDDAMLSVFCRELHKNIPNLEITLLARHPNKALDELYSLKSIRNLDHDSKKESLGRWFRGLNPGDSTEHLREIRKTIEACDLLVIGGEPFIDITIGVYRGLAPYAALLVTLAKFFEKPFMIYGIHIGRPLETELGKELTKFCITNAKLVTLREDFSRKLLVNLGIDDRNIVTLADPAFGLDSIGNDKGKQILENESIQLKSDKIVGVTFRHMYWKWSASDWDYYAKIMSEVCDYMIKTLRVDLLFIPHCTYDIDHKYEDDRPVAKEIIERMKHKEYAHQITNKYNLYEILSLFPLLDMVFSNRRHSLIFAALHGLTGVGTGEEWHMKPVMDQLSIGDKFVNIEEFDMDLLKKRIVETWDNREYIKKKNSEVLPELRKKALMHAKLAADLIR